MKKNNYYKIQCIIEFNFNDSHLCNISYNSFLPELDIKRSQRSKIIMEKQNIKLIFKIESTDITAFRASVNDVIAFGKIIDNTLKITNIT